MTGPEVLASRLRVGDRVYVDDDSPATVRTIKRQLGQLFVTFRFSDGTETRFNLSPREPFERIRS